MRLYFSSFYQAYFSTSFICAQNSLPSLRRNHDIKTLKIPFFADAHFQKKKFFFHSGGKKKEKCTNYYSHNFS